MTLALLEAAVLDGLPPVLAGVFTLVCLLGALLWVVGMGSGRPNTK